MNQSNKKLHIKSFVRKNEESLTCAIEIDGTKEQSMTLFQGRYDNAVRFCESVKLLLIAIRVL